MTFHVPIPTQVKYPDVEEVQIHHFIVVADDILSHLYFTYLFALDLNLGIFIFLYGRCPPCKMIKPVYESLSEEYPDISFGKIDIDDNQDSAMEYEISSVPTFVFFNDKGEKKYGQFSGADQEQLKKIIDDLNKEP